MATNGLSLVGFIADRQHAINHLRLDCVPNPPNADDAALHAIWTAARGQLGPLFPNAGNPAILPIPVSHQRYVGELLQEPWVAAAIPQLGVITFNLVEIEPLLAYQFIVDKDHADHQCQNLTRPPTLDELLGICLPKTQPIDNYYRSPISTETDSVIIKSRNHNLQKIQWGIFNIGFGGINSQVAGLQFHVSLPFVHVVRFDGRCYLHNGYHRTYALRIAGATHVPCILRDVATAEMAGIKADGSTFPESIFAQADAPTLGHFTQARAIDVKLRRKSRVIHVSWHQYSVPDE